MIKVGKRRPKGLHRGTRKQHLLLRGDRPIYLSQEGVNIGAKTWLDANVEHAVTIVEDEAATWFELEIILPGNFTGNPADGWTDGNMRLGLFFSENLTSWVSGGWIASPGKTTETLGDGRNKHFARYSPTPLFWKAVMIDLTLNSNRYGKGITGLEIYQTPVSLPNFPYDMPSEAAQLQADLRAAGYTGAVISSVAAPLSVGITNHLPSGPRTLQHTMSGASVTDIRYKGVTVPLPGYPYAMPSQRAILQTHLRSAGKSGAVVRLYGDVWTLFLPNRLASGTVRDISVVFSPGDPYPNFNLYEEYVGEAPANREIGSSDNVRTPSGAPLRETLKGFARIGFANT